MALPNTVCVLVAEVPGTDRLAEALGTTEAGHAIERCLHRIERAVEANAGTSQRHGSVRISAKFARGDAAILAACEMLERVQSLPPQRGLRMAISIGVHSGEAAEQDVERIAQRLAEAAKPGHGFATAPVFTDLSAGTRPLIGDTPTRNAMLRDLPWPIHPLGRPSGVPTPPPAAPRTGQRLQLRHGETVLMVEETRPVLLFGRELGNDVVIADPRASRQHARIERRRDGFVLIDQSTNGTFLLENGHVEYCIKNEEVRLKGPGRIGCGFSCDEIERDLLFFEIL
ncbi:FHA domain-containing protein [Azoarcus sp. KH32C]|uniref:FHA domain-containing protein n=1 Tax=Azoarcus sp. KH32C TaxID=748247 RepID=UPI0002386E2C|nr:FHA domain-containing protein [Azoarcus sp. KH32C]BAL26619.1 FHA domain-containing protein [Azoarcus sp. KH32C]